MFHGRETVLVLVWLRGDRFKMEFLSPDRHPNLPPTPVHTECCATQAALEKQEKERAKEAREPWVRAAGCSQQGLSQESSALLVRTYDRCKDRCIELEGQAEVQRVERAIERRTIEMLASDCGDLQLQLEDSQRVRICSSGNVMCSAVCC